MGNPLKSVGFRWVRVFINRRVLTGVTKKVASKQLIKGANHFIIMVSAIS